MKNQYVGDINDYGKYIILKSLSDVGLHLAVCWMLTNNDERGDGKRISYLDADEYREYSPQIFDILKNIVKAENRGVSAIQIADMFPGAKYCNQVSEISELGDFDLLFLDPDNGFEVQTKARGKRGAERYVFWDLVTRIYAIGHSLMVYQHFPRVQRLQFMDELTERIKSHTGANLVSHIHTGNVDFVVIPQREHQEKIESAIKNLQVKAQAIFTVKDMNTSYEHSRV